MSQPKRVDTDLQYYMNVTRTIMRAIGTWPLTSTSSTVEKCVKLMLNCACYFLFFLVLIPATLHIIVRERNIYIILKIFAPILNCLMSFVQYCILLYRAQDIRTGTAQMTEDWLNAPPNDRKILLSKAKIGRQLVQFAAIFMYVGCISYCTIIPFTRGLISEAGNVTLRALPCPSYFIKFDEQQTPAFEIIYTLQTCTGFLLFSVRCGLCGLAAFFVMHVCGQLGILIDRMKRFVEEENLRNDVIHKRISGIINLQIKARTFLKQMEEIIEAMCLVEIVGSTTLVCLLGYYVILEWERSDPAAMLTYIILVISFVASIFIFCYIGQHLDRESSDVGLASCTLDWYRLPAKKAHCLILIIAMSNNPMKVTAGKMMDMSLSSFTDIMKAAVAYLNMLRTVT